MHVLTFMSALEAWGTQSDSCYTNQMRYANKVQCHQYAKSSSLEKDEWMWLCASVFLDCHEEVFTFN